VRTGPWPGLWQKWSKITSARHLVDDGMLPGAHNIEAAEQLLEVVRTYLK
jgi:hypothetical protein